MKYELRKWLTCFVEWEDENGVPQLSGCYWWVMIPIMIHDFITGEDRDFKYKIVPPWKVIIDR